MPTVPVIILTYMMSFVDLPVIRRLTQCCRYAVISPLQLGPNLFFVGLLLCSSHVVVSTSRPVKLRCRGHVASAVFQDGRFRDGNDELIASLRTFFRFQLVLPF